MISRVNNINNYHQTEKLTKRIKTKSNSSIEQKVDVYESNSKNLDVNTIYFKEGISEEVFEEIKGKFNISVQPNALNGTQIAIYDISKYASELPYEIDPKEVLSFMYDDVDNLYFHIMLKDPKYKVEVSLNDNFSDLEVLDKSTFENVVMKSLMITCEKLKIEETCGMSKLNDPGRNIVGGKTSCPINYSRSTKSADFKALRNGLAESYDWLIEKDYSQELLEKYKGRYNLQIDPSIVKNARLQFLSVFDEILKDKF